MVLLAPQIGHLFRAGENDLKGADYGYATSPRLPLVAFCCLLYWGLFCSKACRLGPAPERPAIVEE